MEPSYEAPPLPAPPRYAESIAVAVAEGPSATASGIVWSQFFTDPALRALIAQALHNSRDLRLAVLRVEEARALYGIQRSELYPVLGVNASGTRAHTPADLSYTGQSQVASQYRAGLQVPVWELDFWGRVRNLRDAALGEYLATEAARRAATLSLIAQVADGYLSLRELDERLAIAQQTIDSRAESLRIFRRRYEVGATSKLDLAQVETLLTQAQALGAQLEQTRALQRHALMLLVGGPLTELPDGTGVGDENLMRSRLDPGLPSDLLLQRPDIVAAEQRLRAANANIGAARAAFFPSISLTGSYGSASAELEGLFGSGSEAWSFSPSISLPIFDAGRRRSALALAEVRRDLSVANYEKTIQSAFRDVSDALSSRRWLAQQVAYLEAAVAAQSERARLAQKRYDFGAAPYFEVLDAQRDLLSARQQLVQLRRAVLSSRVRLYAALGGGQDAAASLVP